MFLYGDFWCITFSFKVEPNHEAQDTIAYEATYSHCYPFVQLCGVYIHAANGTQEFSYSLVEKLMKKVSHSHMTFMHSQ